MITKYLSKKNILYFIILLLFQLLACNKEPKLPLVINDPVSSYTFANSSYYFADTENKSLSAIRNLAEAEWKPVGTKHKQAERTPEIIWMRIDIVNNTDRINWNLVSEYSFIDKITLYYFDTDKKITSRTGGDSIPVSKRIIKHRLPVMPLQLSPGKNRIWIRIESEIGKMLDFTLEPPENIVKRNKFPYNLYPEFIRLVIIIIIISILCAVYLRNKLFLFYIAYLLSLAIYMGTWEGYALFYIYPENPAWNDHIHYCAGFLFGFFLIKFWKRLLSLSVQLPWYDRIMSVLAWMTFIFAIYALTPISEFFIMIQLARIALIAVIVSASAANFQILKMRQRYALYSMLGFIFILLSFLTSIFISASFVPVDNYTGNPIYIGFSLELIALILSILSRIRFNNELRDREALAAGIKNKSYSRIKQFDLRNLVSALDKLMMEEKVFRDENISLELLAGYLSITRHQLSELIREVYNTNLYGFINDWRIREAKELLVKEKDRTVLSIAMEAGYNSKSTFNQSFRKNTGISPTEFRNKNIKT